MKIAYIAAGAAGMYCGSCLHDNTLARAMLDLGEDVILIPTYTPLRTDEPDVSQRRVFFGGINAYLQQKSRIFRHTPSWLDRLLDHPRLLNLATRHGGSVNPAKLGAMTVSMLRGEAGNQSKEVDKLVDWLIDEVKPDVVHLSNSMLLGMARRINERCGPPVVCSLSGEDIFLEKLSPPYYDQARQLLRERAAEVAAFTTLNGYYADFMAEYLSVERKKIHVVPHGLDLVDYTDEAARLRLRLEIGEAAWEELESTASLISTYPVIGYLARICHDKGLHLLVEACEQFADSHWFEVHVAGYLGASDKRYLAEIQRRVARGPLAGRFKYLGELDRIEKIDFLRGVTIFSTPTVYRESKGLPAIEALAAGTPVVLPEHGSFPELVDETGGGVLHRPHDAAHLAEQLVALIDDPLKAEKLGETGCDAIHEHRQSSQMAQRTLALYRNLTS